MLHGVSIADIHFDAIRADDLYNQLESEFLNYIKEMKKLNLIVIAGDMYHSKIDFNRASAKYSIKFIDELIQIAINKKAKIRILRGTLSHDLTQLDNFKYLETSNEVDFRIINTIEEEVIKGNKILYVPEEYMEDQDEFYKDYFNKNYDLMFFHGTFSHVAFKNQKQESEKPLKNAPVFEYKKLKDIINGFIMGGHIHEKNFYKDKVYYSGSFSRWIFGEEKKKGFIRFSFDKNTKEYKVKFIENKLAPLYTTINIDDIMLSDIDIEDKIKKINKIKKKYNHVRLQFNKTDIKSESDISLLKEYFLSNSDVKLKIEDVTKKIDKDDERNKELEEKYSFIFNKEYELPKILKKYIKIKNGINISEDRIKEILFHKSSD